MINLIIHGCNGAMGQTVTQLAEADPDFRIAAGIDINTQQKNGYPVYASLAECPAEADVLVDFSSARAMDALLDGLEQKGIPAVLCSTGLSEDQLERINALSSRSAVLKSANMSLGINMLMKVLRSVTPQLAEAGFDMEIVEMHHNRKLDAPSGTALALADAMNESVGQAYHYQYDRTQLRQKRDPKEIGIQSLRGGTVVGDHEVIFAGTDEVITFKHTAYSRAIFAKGALAAAKFLAGKPAGFYDMMDVISD